MKKITALLILMMTTVLAQAGNVTPEEAKAKAQTFMQTRLGAGKHHAMKMVTSGQPLRAAAAGRSAEGTAGTEGTTGAEGTTSAEGTAGAEGMTGAVAYYVFNAGDGEGFVVVSGDDRTPAILGYADQGAFDLSNVPENMQAWLDDYARQIDYLDAHPQMAIAKAPASEHAAIRPMLTSTWNQGAPYNNLCPKDGNNRSVTGCVATAMAQVLYYHRYPARTTKTIPGYTTQKKGIKVAAIGMTTIDWANMLDSYSGGETTTQEQAVARLMQLCGASVEMDYSSEASSASSWAASEALKNYFDYDRATTDLDRSNYLAAEWDELIYRELAEDRPVYYSGQSTGGGHAFVVDGYDKDGLYHVNWGWGGYSNGYFLLSILDPGSNTGIGASASTDGYSYEQEAIVGAQPNTGFAPTEEVKMTSYDVMAGETTTFTKNAFGVFPATFQVSMYNMTGATHTFDVGVGVYSPDGDLLYAEDNGSVELDNNWGWSAVELGADVPTLPDGHYLLVPISRENGTDLWYKNGGSTLLFMTATISGDTLSLLPPTIDLSATMQATGSMEKGSKVHVVTTIENNGTLFNDILYLRVNGEKKGGRHFDLDGGETGSLEMTFTPNVTGTHNLELGYSTWEYDKLDGAWEEIFHPIASKSVTITAARNYSLTFSSGRVTNANTSKTINDDKANISVTVRNASSYTYDDDIMTWVFKKGDDDSGYFYSQGTVLTPVSIAAGRTKQVNISVEGLSDGLYWFILVYKSGGEFISYNDEGCYQDLYNYTVSVPSTAIVAPQAAAAEKAIGSQEVYDLSGRRVTNPTKGLYIVGGKKVLVK